MAILVLLIGCTCLGKSNIRPFREAMTEGEYTKMVAQEAQRANRASGGNAKGSLATNQMQGLNSYNNEDYITENAAHASHRPFTETRRESAGMDNVMASQKSYEREHMDHATQRMNNATQGIPHSQIPDGDENLYILKSEIVPPVCPACPTVMECPRQKKCQPCPPCGRCPEPAFECKKVPNYKAVSPSFLPKPILTDFSQFGL